MKLPGDVLLTRDRYVAVYPLWTLPPGPDAEEHARLWTIGLAEQLCFAHGPSYGNKRADPGRPISKDAIGYVPGALPWRPGEMLWAFDMLTGTGTGSPTLVLSPDHQDITGQVFVPAMPVDHLSNGNGPTPVPPTPMPAPIIPYDESLSIQFGLACNDVYRQSGAAMDPGMISVHAMRCAWDYYVGGLTWDQSYDKHLNEFRAVYGLPPI